MYSGKSKYNRHKRMEEKTTDYRLLLGKPGKKPLGRPKLRWVDNIKIDLLEIG
jgi:hypothetical protein